MTIVYDNYCTYDYYIDKTHVHTDNNSYAYSLHDITGKHREAIVMHRADMCKCLD